MSILTTALLSALGALLGAWAGARAAFDRYRSERSFDRQVDWYERAARAIGTCVDALQAARFLEDEKRLDEAAEWYARVRPALMKLGEAAAESDLFAREQGHATIVSSVHQLNAIDRDSKAPAQQDVVAARTEMANRMLPVLRNARLILANELRSQLGLTRIAAPVTPGPDGAA